MRGAIGLFSVVYWVATQVVSFVGLQTKEQTVTIQPGQTTQLDLTLQETAWQLSEVQVRG